MLTKLVFPVTPGYRFETQALLDFGFSFLTRKFIIKEKIHAAGREKALVLSKSAFT